MTRESVKSALEQEISSLLGGKAEGIQDDQLVSQRVNSLGFVQLIAALEARLGITIGDEALYEAAPVTFGDLVDFLDAQIGAQRSPE